MGLSVTSAWSAGRYIDASGVIAKFLADRARPSRRSNRRCNGRTSASAGDG